MGLGSLSFKGSDLKFGEPLAVLAMPCSKLSGGKERRQRAKKAWVLKLLRALRVSKGLGSGRASGLGLRI